jgi:flagellar hook assembly protein FlgD
MVIGLEDEKMALDSARPTPASSGVRISYALREPGPVSLRIYDAAGRLVRTLVNESRQAGDYESTWDRLDDAGRRAPSGIYFYRLESPQGTGGRKVVLVGN